MARRKATPDRSKIVREPTLALSSRKRDDDAKPDAKPEAKPEKADDTAPLAMKPGDAKKPDEDGTSKDETAPLPGATRAPAPATGDAHSGETEPYDRDELDPDSTPEPSPPVATRARTETVGMPAVGGIGRPPEMPHSVAPPSLAFGTVEEPTHMPGPKDIPSGEPSDRAPAPGHVPRGDSRSLRRGDDFALVYRIGTYVISRFGSVGQRGQWRVVEYPTSSSASHSYAKECSRFVSEGFSDYRE